MKNYEVKVTATWWVDVEAENEEELTAWIKEGIEGNNNKIKLIAE
jgi:hypothetical protein